MRDRLADRLSRAPNSCWPCSAPMIATRRDLRLVVPVEDAGRTRARWCGSSWYCGSMPCTPSGGGVVGALHLHAAAVDLGADVGDQRATRAAIARASSTVRRMTRPARSPPACMLVRPPQTMPMFLPSSRAPSSLPRRKPSPVADSTTTDDRRPTGSRTSSGSCAACWRAGSRATGGWLRASAHCPELTATAAAGRGRRLCTPETISVRVPLPTPSFTGDACGGRRRRRGRRPRRTAFLLRVVGRPPPRARSARSGAPRGRSRRWPSCWP